LSAALAGMDLRDLAGLAAEMFERSRPDLPDGDPGRAFEDRAVRLETTFQGAGVLNGNLTPECACTASMAFALISGARHSLSPPEDGTSNDAAGFASCYGPHRRSPIQGF
jgi:hypothetical protein